MEKTDLGHGWTAKFDEHGGLTLRDEFVRHELYLGADSVETLRKIMSERAKS